MKVYVLKDDKNNIRYVGITSGSLRSRLTKHIHDTKYRSKNIDKINWFKENNIFIEEIESCDSYDDLLIRERYWIKYYKNLGFNLVNKTIGGEGCLGYKHTKENIEMMSGINNHRYGKSNLINKERLGIKVEYSIDGGSVWVLFDSISDAELVTSVNYRFIRKMCDGVHTCERDYMFRYYGGEIKSNIKCKIKDQSIRKKSVEVFIDNDWVLYNCAESAASDLGLYRSKIVNVCNGNRKSTGGLFFRYFGMDNFKIENMKSGRKGNRIIVEFNNEIIIYNSMTEASIGSNIPRNTLVKIINGESVNKYNEYKINKMICQ